MNARSVSLPPVQFGRFELRPAQRVLLDGGVPVPLGGRAFDVLVVLAAQAGRLVPKSQLLDEAWPGRCCFRRRELGWLVEQVSAALAPAQPRGLRQQRDVDGDHLARGERLGPVMPQHRTFRRRQLGRRRPMRQPPPAAIDQVAHHQQPEVRLLVYEVVDRKSVV